MQRIEHLRYGGPQTQHLATFEPAAPGPGEVRVRVRAAAINPVDWKIRRGDMRFITGTAFPRAMGLEFSGVVEAVGAAVTRLCVGDAVFGAVPIQRSGAFAEVVVTREQLVARKPPGLSFEQAACLSVAPVAAWRAWFDKARLQAGQHVFVSGCCGAVGQAAVQLARRHGAQVAGSCSAADLQIARELGVDPVFDYRQPLPESLKGSFDAVFDTAGQLPVPAGLALLKPRRGVLLDINFTPARLLRGLLSRRYKVVMGTQTVDVLNAVAAAAAAGTLQIDVGRTAPLAQAIALITEVEQRRKGHGRAVIVMG